MEFWNNMPSVFISYAREDQDFARELFDALHAAGHQPSWDQDHEAVPFSAPWRSEIRNAIDNSDKFIFIISPDSLESRECTNELAHAVEVHKHIIPVERRPPRGEQAVPESIEELNWVDFTNAVAFDKAFDYLTKAINTDLDWTKAHTRLLARSIEWTTGSSDRSLLLRGNELRTAEVWLSGADGHPQTPPTPTQREYITASRHAADRSTRLSRGALALGLVTAVLLATLAFIQRNQARHEANIAQARALAAEATADLSSEPGHSLRLALASTQQDATSTGLRALRLALAADKDRMAFQPGFGSGTQAIWSPVGEVIAATGHRNSVQLWDPRSGKLIHVLGFLPNADPISQLAYDRQGRLLAAVGGSPVTSDAVRGFVALWNVRSRKVIPLNQVNEYIRAHLKDVGETVTIAVTWDPQSDDLFIYGPDLRGVLVYIPATGKVLTLLPTQYVSNITFAASGSRAFVLTGEPGSRHAHIMVFRNETFKAGARLTIPPGWLDHSACWMPDGKEVATWDQYGAQDNTLRVFNARTGSELFQRVGVYTSAACGESTTAGSYVVAGDITGDGVLVHTADVGVEVHWEFTAIGLYGHTQAIYSAAVSGDGSDIATGANDGTVRIWSSVNGRQLSLIASSSQPVTSVQFSPDGGAVLAVGEDGVVRVADAGVGEPDVLLNKPRGGRTYALGFAAGSRFVYGLNEITRSTGVGSAHMVKRATAMLWSVSTGSIIAHYRLPGAPMMAKEPCPFAISITTFCNLGAPAKQFSGYTVSGDGRYISYSNNSGVVVRRFKDNATECLRLPVAATGLAFAGATDDLVVSTNSAVYIWRPVKDSGHLMRIPQPTAPLDTELSADGNRMATANADGRARLWDTHTEKALGRFTPHPVHFGENGKTAVERVALNANGTELATGTQFGSIDLWELPNHKLVKSQLVGTPGNKGYAITNIEFSASGSLLMGVNYPVIGAGSAEPAASTFILAAQTGRVVNTLVSPSQILPPVNSGVALSSNGSDVLSGVEGFAPDAARAGSDAVYDVHTGEELTNLQNALRYAPPVNAGRPNLTPLTTWASDGVHLLAGAPYVYICDACGSLTQMQEAAKLRLAWNVPLTPAHDVPPSTDAFS